tara:strand:+ start:1616 stop:2095 length:480 start_codon:yes stop_codon:yes gene_type:complete
MNTYQIIFEITFFVFFGLTMEIIFSVCGIERCLGKKLKKQTPHKYLEGFVSLYMIPIHGLGVYFLYKPFFYWISDFPISARYVIWALAFTKCEIIGGFIYKKILGFYPWDYYKESKFKIFKDGYSLWTLIPCWGIAGLVLEKYVKLITFLSSKLSEFSF